MLRDEAIRLMRDGKILIHEVIDLEIARRYAFIGGKFCHSDLMQEWEECETPIWDKHFDNGWAEVEEYEAKDFYMPVEMFEGQPAQTWNLFDSYEEAEEWADEKFENYQIASFQLHVRSE